MLRIARKSLDRVWLEAVQLCSSYFQFYVYLKFREDVGVLSPQYSGSKASAEFSKTIYYTAKCTWCVIGIRPNNLVAFVGPHSPLAQSGNGTITVCSSSHEIRNLQTLLNFIGSPVRYSFGVTELANMSRRKAPLLGACTRNDTMLPITDCNIRQNPFNSNSGARIV